MKKILLAMLAVTLLVTPSYPADDDSTPYNPYPEPQPQAQTQTQTQNQSQGKPQAKKSQAKKRPAKRKPAPNKKRAATRRRTPAKAAAPKDSLLQRAIALMEQGNYEQAKRYLLRAMNVNRNDPNVWYWYGKYHEYIGNYYQAQYFYSKAVKIDPSFEKLSRVVYYPKDPEKTPLWDPKRPARVYPVETGGKGITTMTPDAIDRVTYPKADNNDPALPKVPVYTPPQPNSSPSDGDKWAPSVYVPPAPQDTDSTIRNVPVYTPPATNSETPNYLPPVPLANNGENLGIIKEGSSIYQEVDEIVRVNQENSGPPLSERDRIVRADKPLYNPDSPRQKVTANDNRRTRRTQTQQVKKTETAKKKQPAKKTSKKESKQENTPAPRTKTVRRQQTQRQREEPRTQPVQPQTPEPRPVQPREPEPRQEPRELPREPQTQTQSQTRTQREETRQQPRQQQYMPPVGQYEPDPGTISETPMPPVGQGN